MHLRAGYQICSNQVCVTYFYRLMLVSFFVITQNAYLYITLCHYVKLLFRPHLLKIDTDLPHIICVCFLG